MTEFDVTELVRLEHDLDGIVRPLRRVAGVVDKGAVNIKGDWRDNARITARAHGRHYPDAIDYDSGWIRDGYEAQIGPRMDRPQGSMGEGFEYGSVNQPPHLDGNRAADREAPRFEQALADLAAGLL